jgi:hypothetical protein
MQMGKDLYTYSLVIRESTFRFEASHILVYLMLLFELIDRGASNVG